ncbi:MAG TPA: DUF4287 domain-containing protein [Nevskiaceae bacterium]|nr:DUF4287 domain-containing protein [Nevskiaceae bacterium]
MSDAPRLSHTLARLSDAALLKATGRDGAQWLALLDEAGAKAWPHREIAAWLAREHRLPAWWAQAVTVGFEQSRGLREAHQKARGFAASISRTLDLPLDALYDRLTTTLAQDPGLRDLGLTVSRATPGKGLRLHTAAGETVAVRLSERPDQRCQITIDHQQLPSAEAVPLARSRWQTLLDGLKAEYRRLG